MQGRANRPPATLPLLGAALAALAVAACRTDAPEPVPEPVGGSASEPLRADAAPLWRLADADLRVDAGPGGEPLQYVEAAVEGPDGRLHTLHARERFVRSWSVTGEPAGRLGEDLRYADGLPDPFALGTFGDTLWLMDRQTHVVALFGTGGEPLGVLEPSPASEPPGPAAWDLPPRPRRPLRDGTFLGVSPEVSEAVSRGDQRRTVYVRMDAGGAVLDTLWIRPWEPDDVLPLPRVSGGAFGSQPFGDAPLATMSPDGVLVVVDRRVTVGEEPPAFQVTWIGPRGDTLVRSTVAYEPVLLTPGLVAEALSEVSERWAAFLLDAGDSMRVAEVRRNLTDSLDVPEHMPPVTSLVTGSDGSAWLRRSAPEGDVATEWWVLEPDGGFRARVSAPADLRILHAGPEHVVGTRIVSPGRIVLERRAVER